MRGLQGEKAIGRHSFVLDTSARLSPGTCTSGVRTETVSTYLEWRGGGRLRTKGLGLAERLKGSARG